MPVACHRSLDLHHDDRCRYCLRRAVRTGVERHGEERSLEREIPLPGLHNVQSQLAVPLLAHHQLLGVLCLQSQRPGRFTADDERLALVAGRHIAASMAALRLDVAPDPEQSQHGEHGVAPGAAVVKYYRSDDSILIDDHYLVKGLPGRIFWKLVRTYLREGRVDFTNKEIRLDHTLKLPDIKDNLETRLILLRRRIQDRCNFLKIVPTGRGRFRFLVKRSLVVEEHP